MLAGISEKANMKIFIFTALLLASQVALNAAELISAHSIERVNFLKLEGNAVILKADMETLRISILSPTILRVQATTNAAFPPSLMVESGFVKTDWPPCNFDVRYSADTFKTPTSAVKVEVPKAPSALEIFSAGGASLFKTARTAGIEIG